MEDNSKEYAKTIDVNRPGGSTGNEWTVVSRNRKKVEPPEPPRPVRPPQYQPPMNSKIPEPCWFFNTGGCRHKDGSEKSAHECKYLHVTSFDVRRPPHLNNRKPCDKYNLEGVCKWGENCKYSHRNLTPEEWSKFYPGIPYTLKTNTHRRKIIEGKVQELESRIKILEYKLKSMDEYYEKQLNELLRKNNVL